mgnify:CR=1 FL=1
MGATTDTAATLGYLARALKAPTIGRVWEQLATTARAEGWSVVCASAGAARAPKHSPSADTRCQR